MIFHNIHDSRYRFDLINNGNATFINQLDPPGNPVAWFPSIWAQWNRSVSTAGRAERLVKKLQNENPVTAWFQKKVNWTY